MDNSGRDYAKWYKTGIKGKIQYGSTGIMDLEQSTS
jgi:hypothetical protein